MRTNYNESSGRGGRYSKRQSSNRRSSNRRSSNNSSNATTNVASVTAKRNKFLDMAKEALSNGNRVEAENYYQHAEHYSKMLSAIAPKKENSADKARSSDQKSEDGKQEKSNVEEDVAQTPDDTLKESDK